MYAEYEQHTSVFTIGPFGPCPPPLGPSGSKIGNQTKTVKELLKLNSLQWLNGLALLFIHRDIPLNHDAVIDEFSMNNRRLQF